MTPIQPVILSGGSGTRLWPLSRETHPKQLLPLIGNETLLQSTARRLDGWRGSRPVSAPIVVSNEEYRFITAEQFRQIGRPLHSVILEPVGRNTAPALALAAMAASGEGSDPILLAMPADQVMRTPEAFCTAVEAAAALASDGTIVTFGITPDRPETGYGYLRLGDAWPGCETARQLERFVEKPDAGNARIFADDGRHLWNAGIFMVRASVWLAALARYAPEMARRCEAAFRAGERDGMFFRIGREAFLATPSDSIDYAVMEPMSADPEATPAAVLPVEAGWSDVGAWDALWRVADKDDAGNVVSGDGLLEDVGNSLVISQGRLVACLGLRDTIVIETPDVVFVASADRAPEVRKIVARLKSAERNEACAHRKRHRPWGYYDTIDCGDRFHVKRIVVNPKASLSLQMHHHRAEHWVVVRGTAEVTRGDETFLLSENESTYIPIGVRHRLANPGKLPLEMIEVQSGAYLGEDDIVRFLDDYGRTGEAA